MHRGPPGVVIGGTGSGVGKTVATLAVLSGLTAEYDVQPAKIGPDFIDPGHHEAVTGRHSRTLDPWLEGETGMRRTYAHGGGDLCVAEGVMGLYDGPASTAQVAASLDLPVVLVVDASGGMESVGATALGFDAYGSMDGTDAAAVDVVGVIAQRAAGGRHAAGIKTALPEDIAYLGRIPRDDRLEIPDRHLGLHGDMETTLPETALQTAAEHLDLDRLVECARRPSGVSDRPGSSTDVQIAIAQDGAFRFYYPRTIERLQRRGSVTTFSPLAGDTLPACDAVYLPGGYPELYAETLAASPTLATVAERAADGLPVYGECGGLMALAETLTVDGTTHQMAGVLPAQVDQTDRRQALGYVELTAQADTLIADAGTQLHGHEFHYSRASVDSDARFQFDVTRGEGINGDHDGLTEYRTLGTYAHHHPESGAFDTFLESCSR